MKKCSKCGVLKEDEYFISEKGKVFKTCSSCRDYIKRYRKERAAKIKEYYRKNADKIVENNKKYNRKNIEKITAYLKKYRKDNNGRIKEYLRLHRDKKARYATYADKLTVDEQAESNAKGDLIVRCFKCGSKFVPTNAQAQNRVKALSVKGQGECHFYCSQECKDSCSIYKVNYDPAEASHDTSALRNPEWAQLVKERDGFTCQKCGDTEDVQAHHIEPVALRPDLADDLDNGITLCTSCHREIHKHEGCDLGYLRRNKVRAC